MKNFCQFIFMSSLKRIRFQREEEDILREVVELYKKDWRNKGDVIEATYNEQIKKFNKENSKDFSMRTKKILKQHWDQVSNPAINKLTWSDEEIEKLKELYKRYPKQWDVIGKQLGTNRCKFWIMNECVRQGLLSKKELQTEIENDKKTKLDESKAQLINAAHQFMEAFEYFISCLD